MGEIGNREGWGYYGDRYREKLTGPGRGKGVTLDSKLARSRARCAMGHCGSGRQALRVGQDRGQDTGARRGALRGPRPPTSESGTVRHWKPHPTVTVHPSVHRIWPCRQLRGSRRLRVVHKDLLVHLQLAARRPKGSRPKTEPGGLGPGLAGLAGLARRGSARDAGLALARLAAPANRRGAT